MKMDKEVCPTTSLQLRNYSRPQQLCLNFYQIPENPKITCVTENNKKISQIVIKVIERVIFDTSLFSVFAVFPLV